MSTDTQTHPAAAAALRSLAAGRLRWNLNHILTSFAATPDDKLDFKPSETANSPRQLIQHVIGGNGVVAQSFGIASAPSGSPAELESAPAATDRESLTTRLRETTETIINHIENLPDEAMDTTVQFISRPLPMTSFLLLDDWHITRHAGQLDYLQTIWGDLEDRF